MFHPVFEISGEAGENIPRNLQMDVGIGTTGLTTDGLVARPVGMSFHKERATVY